jgi:hypothetical protein
MNRLALSFLSKDAKRAKMTGQRRKNSKKQYLDLCIFF